jgi:hypothetical protein
MLLRWLIGITIIGVAVTMTTALVRMAYFPEESRLAQEAPQLVLERFLSRTGAESVLDIWKGKEIVGSLRVAPYQLMPSERVRLDAHGRLRVEADLQVALPGLEGTKVRLSSTLVMALDGAVRESDLTLSSNNFSQSLTLHQALNATEPRIVLKQGEEILMDTAGGKLGGQETEMLLGLFARSVGVDPQELRRRQSQAQATVGKSATEARRGGFTVAEREFTGYVLTTTMGGPDRKFTLYISDSGELVQMKTSFLDYQFISEDLRPEGVLGPIPRSAKNKASSAPLAP